MNEDEARSEKIAQGHKAVQDFAKECLEKLRKDADRPEHFEILKAAEEVMPLVTRDSNTMAAMLGFVTMLLVAFPQLALLVNKMIAIAQMTALQKQAFQAGDLQDMDLPQN